MPEQIDIASFLKLNKEHPILDVRTPAEFEHGHIPGAINLPLFDNEERKIVGTLYKEQGRERAILKGLDLVGPKMSSFIEDAIKLNTTGAFLVHCWRGGMRSGSLSWLLEMYGYKIYTLKGGYKSFRRFALASFDEKKEIIILGGKTGSGKTLVLDELKNKGQQAIDLEKHASHKGSSFGSLGEEKQPTQEQFENNIAFEMQMYNDKKIIWLEDESRTIGNKVIPGGLWEQMRSAPVLFIDIPFNKRVEYLTKEYGKYDIALLKESILRILKRLGPQHTKHALEALEDKNLSLVCEICLNYYDKAYQHGIDKREKEKMQTVSFNDIAPSLIAKEIINTADKWIK